MHEILATDQTFTKARTKYADAEATLEEMLAKVEKAHRDHAQKIREALDRGEVYAPRLEPIPSQEVEQHVRGRVTEASHDYARVVREQAQRLRVLFEDRHDELLDVALSTPAGDLEPLAQELTSLLDSWSYVDAIANSLRHTHDRLSRDVTAGPVLTVVDVLAAATGTRSLTDARQLIVAAEEDERARSAELARVNDRVRP